MTVNFKLIAGLGNPGKEYAATRHNAGAWWLQKLCALYHAELQPNSKFHGMLAKITINDNNLYCLLPLTYMNLSGKAISSIAHYYDINPESILIVHDDLDLPVGTIRLKNGGGHGGHNGLKDIVSALQSKDFYRLRIGISHPGHKDAVTDYVLQQPSKADKLAIDAVIEESLKIFPKIIQGELIAAMNHLHNFSA
jgi:PTH1 family peptidyl-tRNA hydrolase